MKLWAAHLPCFIVGLVFYGTVVVTDFYWLYLFHSSFVMYRLVTKIPVKSHNLIIDHLVEILSCSLQSKFEMYDLQTRKIYMSSIIWNDSFDAGWTRNSIERRTCKTFHPFAYQNIQLWPANCSHCDWWFYKFDWNTSSDPDCKCISDTTFNYPIIDSDVPIRSVSQHVRIRSTFDLKSSKILSHKFCAGDSKKFCRSTNRTTSLSISENNCGH